jgi:ADP-heptose:LPS heptosyltransferase
MGVLGHPVPEGLEPRIYFTQEDLEHARGLLSVSAALDHKPLAVLVTQTSPTQRKKWREERFVESAHWLSERHDCRIVLVGTAGESAAIEQTRQRIGGDCISLAGATTIPVLAAALALTDVCLTLDSGIFHVARSEALPSCVIAPAWSPVYEWLPIGNPRFRILKNLDLPVAPADYIIDEVSVAEVCATLDALLETSPPSVMARESRVWRSFAGARIVSGRLAQPLQTSG